MFLSLDTDGDDLSTLSVFIEAEVEERIARFGTYAYVAESYEDVFKVGNSFDSFYHQTKYTLLDIALLVGFLMLWLKR